MRGTRSEYKWVPTAHKNDALVGWGAVQKDTWECACNSTDDLERSFVVGCILAMQACVANNQADFYNKFSLALTFMVC